MTKNNNPVISQLIFNDGHIKSRLIKMEGDYYRGEWKYVKDIDEYDKPNRTFADDKENRWAWWICGTSKWLGLTEQEKAWAK